MKPQTTIDWAQVYIKAQHLGVQLMEDPEAHEICRAAHRHAFAQMVRLNPYTAGLALMAVEGRAE